MGTADITPTARLLILLATNDRVVDGKPVNGAFAAVARAHNCSRSAVSRLWTKHGPYVLAMRPLNPDALLARLLHKRSTCGAKGRAMLSVQTIVAAASPEAKQTFQSLSAATNIPASSLHRYYHKGWLKTASSSLKPALTKEHMASRVEFCLTKINETYEPNSTVLSFASFENVVHLDEKIFRITRDRRKYILAPWETAPQPRTRNKRFVGQLMFLAAVAKPRHDPNRNRFFDGKVGIWPFVETTYAKRASKHRPRGSPILSEVPVTKKSYLDMLTNKVIPALVAKWPRNIKNITLQHDNAPAHSPAGLFWAGHGLVVTIECQPAQSPDLNVLDLGYFSAIQALQQRKRSKDIEELVTTVEQSFLELEPEKLENIFYTWPACMEQIMLQQGGNGYKIPHLQKSKERRTRGSLPQCYVCSLEAVTTAYLSQLEPDVR